jgi:hypothetical protein
MHVHPLRWRHAAATVAAAAALMLSACNRADAPTPAAPGGTTGAQPPASAPGTGPSPAPAMPSSS